MYGVGMPAGAGGDQLSDLLLEEPWPSLVVRARGGAYCWQRIPGPTLGDSASLEIAEGAARAPA